MSGTKFDLFIECIGKHHSKRAEEGTGIKIKLMAHLFNRKMPTKSNSFHMDTLQSVILCFTCEYHVVFARNFTCAKSGLNGITRFCCFNIWKLFMIRSLFKHSGKKRDNSHPPSILYSLDLAPSDFFLSPTLTQP